MTRSLL